MLKEGIWMLLDVPEYTTNLNTYYNANENCNNDL